MRNFLLIVNKSLGNKWLSSAKPYIKNVLKSGFLVVSLEGGLPSEELVAEDSK